MQITPGPGECGTSYKRREVEQRNEAKLWRDSFRTEKHARQLVEHELEEAQSEIKRHHDLITYLKAQLGSAIAELESLRGESPFTRMNREFLNREVG